MIGNRKREMIKRKSKITKVMEDKEKKREKEKENKKMKIEKEIRV